MADDKKSQDVLEALEKAEKYAAELNARKLRLQEKEKKKVQPEEEKPFAKRLKEQNIQKASESHQIKTFLVFFYILSFLGIGVYYSSQAGMDSEKVFLFIAVLSAVVFYAYHRSTK